MYSYVKGQIAEINTDGLVIETNGIGYDIQMGNTLINQLGAIGEEVKCYVYFHITQDRQQLFGFPSKEYKQLFEKLITVSGVGPKAGLALLEEFRPTDLALTIVREDSDLIVKRMKGKGVGKKTAERIILELKDKFKHIDAGAEDDYESIEEDHAIDQNSMSMKDDVIQGLIFLGYNLNDAKRMVNQSFDPSLEIEDNLKLALKVASK